MGHLMQIDSFYHSNILKNVAGHPIKNLYCPPESGRLDRFLAAYIFMELKIFKFVHTDLKYIIKRVPYYWTKT